MDDNGETVDLSGHVLGAKNRQAEPPKPGRVLADRYRLGAMLGKGGMGVVLRARDTAVDRDVAVKLLLAGDLDPEQAERFRREGELAAAIAHSGIVRVHDAGIDDGRPFLVYELIEGARTLTEVLPEVDLDRKVELFRQAAEALGAAHDAGIVHRDVKPENILVDAQGRARVTDFGAALQGERARLTASGAVLGTPAFMAPEQVRGDRAAIGPPTDVWALGVSLYEAVCGAPPFPAGNLAELFATIGRGNFTPPSEHFPAIPSWLAGVIGRCLRTDPRARYRDGHAVAAALVPPDGPPAGVPALKLLAGLAIAVGIVLGALLLRPQPKQPAAAHATSSAPPTSTPTSTPSAAPSPTAAPDPAVRLGFLNEHTVRRAEWAAGGARIAMSLDGAGVLWDAERSRRQQRWPTTQGMPALAAQGDRVAFGLDRTLLIVDARDGKVLHRADMPAQIKAVAFTPDGGRLAVGGYWPEVRILELPSARARTPIVTVGSVSNLHWSPDGTLLAISHKRVMHEHAELLITLWRPDRDPPLRVRERVMAGRIARFAFHPTRLLLFMADSSGGVTELDREQGRFQRFDSEAGRIPIVARAHDGRALWVEVGPEGRRLASTSSGRKHKPKSAEVRVWDLETHRTVFVQTFKSGVGTLSLSPDRAKVLLAIHAYGVEIWPASRFFPPRGSRR